MLQIHRNEREREGEREREREREGEKGERGDVLSTVPWGPDRGLHVTRFQETQRQTNNYVTHAERQRERE